MNFDNVKLVKCETPPDDGKGVWVNMPPHLSTGLIYNCSRCKMYLTPNCLQICHCGKEWYIKP